MFNYLVHTFSVPTSDTTPRQSPWHPLNFSSHFLCCARQFATWNVWDCKPTQGEGSNAINLLNDNNYNLTGPQKDMMLWHCRSGHSRLGWIQDLMRKRKQEHGEMPTAPPIPSRLSTVSTCKHPKCPACQLSKQHRRNPGSETACHG